MLQVSLVSFNVTSYLTRTCPHHVVPRVVHGCSVFHRSWHCHSLANRIASNGHKSISNMLRGFHLMGCNPTDTQMILSYHMGDRVFNHSRAVRPQILSLIIVIYISDFINFATIPVVALKHQPVCRQKVAGLSVAKSTSPFLQIKQFFN